MPKTDASARHLILGESPETTSGWCMTVAMIVMTMASQKAYPALAIEHLVLS